MLLYMLKVRGDVFWWGVGEALWFESAVIS